MQYSEYLIQKAEPILKEILNHPFVEGIKTGKLSQNAISFYVQQDYQYLDEFVHIYGQAISCSQDRVFAQFFNEQISFLMGQESKAHQILCQAAQLNYAELKNAIPSPKAYLYQSHMLRAGKTGSLLNILAALQPCPWTYLEIGRHLTANSTSENPYQDWINFYADSSTTTEKIFKFIDQLAKNATDNELKIATQYFLKSCELEWQFWQQAYYQEDWRFKQVLTAAEREPFS
ncbi:thiaminase II [Convivina praedatoris]|uniref:Aminopyrimidine aminohydrolase n=1 Tax=Convivina praedatoris TaxID=2880963 RepID=A0ABN8HCI3_9LACO|nr:thiaminase II [Convivina sp. LMG 32447]CAH1851882.1 Aminopyrimidine aminohydrolase [Convivina sp. LMG 32447]CAH1853949.1 Aminopyrimidine aminohydrolase [Convivina sp. LMG 32447]CAH1854090.1 Aminopyrimidine aminohydrolase [Convivina sp. LMG 32447]